MNPHSTFTFWTHNIHFRCVQLRHCIYWLRIGTTNGRAVSSEELRAQHPEAYLDFISAFSKIKSSPDSNIAILPLLYIFFVIISLRNNWYVNPTMVTTVPENVEFILSYERKWNLISRNGVYLLGFEYEFKIINFKSDKTNVLYMFGSKLFLRDSRWFWWNIYYWAGLLKNFTHT